MAEKKTAPKTAPKSKSRKVAVQSFRTAVSDEYPRGQYVGAGLVLKASDPLVKAYPSLFVDEADWQSLKVEQATAAPGETRNVKLVD